MKSGVWLAGRIRQIRFRESPVRERVPHRGSAPTFALVCPRVNNWNSSEITKPSSSTGRRSKTCMRPEARRSKSISLPSADVQSCCMEEPGWRNGLRQSKTSLTIMPGRWIRWFGALSAGLPSSRRWMRMRVNIGCVSCASKLRNSGVRRMCSFSRRLERSIRTSRLPLIR